MANNLNLSECTATFTPKKHYEFPGRLKFLHGSLTHPTLGELASVECIQIINRFLFKNHDDFFEIMDAQSQELQEFAVSVFDNHSNVQPRLVDGGSKSGSGCWGHELSVGDMLYIKDLRVKENFRRSGVGSLLLQQLLDSHKGIAYAWPTLGSKATSAEWEQGRTTITAFYRKNGFRRIGLTYFFAYSPDPAHPSRNIPASSDPDPPSTNFNGPELSPEQAEVQYPIHHGIATNQTASIAGIIRDAFRNDNASIRSRDHCGFLPIHLAAGSKNVHAICALLELCPGGVAEDLKDKANKDGSTPLELLDAEMWSDKSFAQALLGSWDGYSDEAMRCRYMLEKAAGSPLAPGLATEAEYAKQKRYGCTCGTCTDGWLSPRMRFRLSTQAALQNDMMSMDVDQFSPRKPIPYSEMVLHSAFDYVPEAVRSEIYKTFYVGLYTAFNAIYLILDAPGSKGIPTPNTVLSTALSLDPRPIQFFIGKGGKMEHVIDATVEISKEQSSLGDGTFEETFEDEFDEGDSIAGGELESELPTDYTTLPKCANDLEFALVKRKLGLSHKIQWGPYRSSYDLEDEEMNIDEDDDDDDDDEEDDF